MNNLILYTNAEGSVSSICINGAEDITKVRKYILDHGLNDANIIDEAALPEKKLEYCKIVNDEFVSDEEYKANKAMQLLREEREKLLIQSDWRDLPSYPGTDQAAWRTYRQELRDITETQTSELDEFGNLTNITWPTPPENS